MSNIVIKNKENTSLRDLPEMDFSAILMRLGVYMDSLISLDGEKSTRRLEILLPMVKECAMGLTIKELEEAFLMYVKGQLEVEPIDNYMTVIQFNKVINSYKSWKVKVRKPEPIKALPTHKDSAENIINRELERCAEQIRRTGYMNGTMTYTYIYDYLDKKGLMPKSARVKKLIWEDAVKNVARNSGQTSPKRLKRILEDARQKNSLATIVEAKRISLEKYVKKNIL